MYADTYKGNNNGMHVIFGVLDNMVMLNYGFV